MTNQVMPSVLEKIEQRPKKDRCSEKALTSFSRFRADVRSHDVAAIPNAASVTGNLDPQASETAVNESASFGAIYSRKVLPQRLSVRVQHLVSWPEIGQSPRLFSGLGSKRSKNGSYRRYRHIGNPRDFPSCVRWHCRARRCPCRRTHQ